MPRLTICLTARLVLSQFKVRQYNSFLQQYLSQSRPSRPAGAAICEVVRFHVVARAIAKRSGELAREERLGKWGKPDVEGRSEDEAVAS